MYYMDGPPERRSRSADKSPLSGYNYMKGIVLKSQFFCYFEFIYFLENEKLVRYIRSIKIANFK